MQAERDPRHRGQQRERPENDPKGGVVKAGDHAERYCVQRVARREAEMVEHARAGEDLRIHLVGPVAHRAALQHLVAAGADGADEGHVQHRQSRAVRIGEQQRQHQRVPEDPVSEPAHRL